MGVNHLGHFYLTNLLMPALRMSDEARIVNLSSMGHAFGANSLNFEDLMMEKNYTGDNSYRASKLANVYNTKTLAQNLKGTNIKTVSLHPGVVRTSLGRHVIKPSFLI